MTTEKVKLNSDTKGYAEVPHYVTFSELTKMGQVGLEKLLLEGKTIYLLSKKIPPTKLTLAKLS